MGRLREGSVAERVIQRVTSPVLIVPAGENDAGKVTVPPFGHIVWPNGGTVTLRRHFRLQARSGQGS